MVLENSLFRCLIICGWTDAPYFVQQMFGFLMITHADTAKNCNCGVKKDILYSWFFAIRILFHSNFSWMYALFCDHSEDSYSYFCYYVHSVYT